jgi:hypothetical protein
MSGALIVSLACLGAVGGFSAGLLGFGGGVIMFPLLYYVPPLLGLAPLDAKSVAAIVVTQVFFSTLVGGIAHLRQGRVHTRLAVTAGIASAFGSFIGAIASQWATETFLLILFGLSCLIVLFIMGLSGSVSMSDREPVDEIKIAFVPLALCSTLTGVIIGFLGAGNFVFVPLLIYILKVPTRIAIGSTLLIALMNTATGFFGKLLTGQIPLAPAAVVVSGAAIGAVFGERIHGKTSAARLRHIYAAMVAIIALRVWLSILR